MCLDRLIPTRSVRCRMNTSKVRSTAVGRRALSIHRERLTMNGHDTCELLSRRMQQQKSQVRTNSTTRPYVRNPRNREQILPTRYATQNLRRINILSYYMACLRVLSLLAMGHISCRYLERNTLLPKVAVASPSEETPYVLHVDDVGVHYLRCVLPAKSAHDLRTCTRPRNADEARNVMKNQIVWQSHGGRNTPANTHRVIG